MFHAEHVSHQYYAIGNTFGFDLSEGQELAGLGGEGPERVDVLFGACGDVRNILKTCEGLLSPARQSRPKALHFVLNDQCLSILARDVVLLHLIAGGMGAEDVVSIWANHALTKQQRGALDEALAELAARLPAWLALPEPGGGGARLTARLSEAFLAWKDASMSLADVLERRRTFIRPGEMDDSTLEFVIRAVGPSLAARFDSQIRKQIQSGNACPVSAGHVHPNLTLLESPTLQYSLYWSSSIYRAMKLDSSAANDASLWDCLVRSLAPQVAAVKQALVDGVLSVSLLLGDVVSNLAAPNTMGCCFDFVDLSNVADYCSLPSVVQAALPLLKATPQARIHVQSMLWRAICDDPDGERQAAAGKAKAGQREKMDKNPRDEPAAFALVTQYLKRCLGMDLATYESLLDLRLLPPVTTDAAPLRPVLHLAWARAAGSMASDPSPRPPSWLSGAFLLLECMASAKVHCALERGLGPEGLQRAGANISSPATLLHLLRVGAPPLALPLVRFLTGAHGPCKAYAWELLTHALLQEGPASGTAFVVVSFVAKAEFLRLMTHSGQPLCLVVSKAALPKGACPPSAAVQIIETFSYDVESDRAEFILQRAIAEDAAHKALFVTLCSIRGSRLEAIGVSVKALASAARPLTAAAWPLWRAAPAGSLHPAIDVGVLSAPDQASTASGWAVRSVRECGAFVSLEILLPRPFPSAGEASLAVDVVGDGAVLRISVTRVQGKAAAPNAGTLPPFAFPSPFDVALPCPVSLAEEQRVTKCSRGLGMMAVRLSRVDGGGSSA